MEHKLVTLSSLFPAGDVDKKWDSCSVPIQPTWGRRNGAGLEGDHFLKSRLS